MRVLAALVGVSGSQCRGALGEHGARLGEIGGLSHLDPARVEAGSLCDRLEIGRALVRLARQIDGAGHGCRERERFGGFSAAGSAGQKYRASGREPST
jgi:hypothetical protein